MRPPLPLDGGMAGWPGGVAHPNDGRNAAMTEKEPQIPQVPRGPEVPDARRGTVWALLFVLLLVFGGLFLVHTLRHMARVQDCAISGRSNCGAIDSSSPSY